MGDQARKITVLFNNIAGRSDLQTAHGFSCLFEGRDRTILFDTGCDGTLLLENMAKLEKDPAKVDTVVISHMHWDHSGGLFQFLHVNPKVTVYLPSSCVKNFRLHAEWLGARTELVDDPNEIAEGIVSTGTMDREGITKEMREQSLVVESGDGTVLVTGCAHPGIVPIAERARQLRAGPLQAVLGGFHLVDASESDIDAVADAFTRLEVGRVGASHCTGGPAIANFEKRWQGDFVPFGLGATYQLSA